MGHINSSNPNLTSGRAASVSSSLSYPVTEKLTKKTVIKFVEYDRDRPDQNPKDHISAIITLPLPLGVPDNINIRTSSYNMGARGNADELYDFATGGKVKDTLSGIFQSYGNSNDIPKDIARAIALMPIPINDDRSGITSIIGGVVKNPHTTTAFDGVDIRSYNLTWRMSPRSQKESDVLDKICKKMRERVYPEESSKGYALEYPDLVYVDFEGPVKPYLPQFYRSFVTNLVISNSNGGEINTYQSGAPIEVEISMQCIETSIVTRNRIRDGK